MSDPYDRFERGDDGAVGAVPPLRPSDALPLAHETELAAPKALRWPRFVIGSGLVVYGLMIVGGIGTGSFEMIDAIPLIPILAYVAFRIGKRLASYDGDPSVTELVFAAFWAKMLGTLVRAAVVSWIYGDRSDALDYHKWGQYYAPQFRGLDFSHVSSWSGTDFMRSFTGIVYSFTGASQVSGAIVMSFLSFIGLLLLWRAFKLAVPSGDSRRYALLVLFLPSLLYWPSALGKEGWAIFCLGVASYGVARVMTGTLLRGIALVLAGGAGVMLMRPHVALTMFCGISLAGLVGRSRKGDGKSSLLRIALFGVLLVAGAYLASSTAEFFGVPSLNQETINETLNNAEGRTSEAGSSFTPVSMTKNPANAPLAFITVLFRPLPIEATSGVAAATAMEGVFLMVLTVRSRRRLRSLFRSMRREPYTAYSVGILVTFVYAFSAFSNFGILARERCQVLPFFLVLLCLPEWRREGVISVEEALKARDVPDGSGYTTEDTVDPYWSAVEANPADPYAGAEPAADPYRHLRAAPPRDY